MPISGGKYATEVQAGRVHILSTAAAGVALPISTGTAVTFGVWNTSVDKYVIPLWFAGGYTSGTIALGSLGFANQNAGFALGTAAPLSAFTDAVAGTSIKNALAGTFDTPPYRATPSTATLTAGGTGLMVTGHSIESATAGLGVFTWNHDFDGRIILAPGQLLFVCGSVAQTGLFTMSLACAWAPIPK